MMLILSSDNPRELRFSYALVYGRTYAVKIGVATTGDDGELCAQSLELSDITDPDNPHTFTIFEYSK